MDPKNSDFQMKMHLQEDKNAVKGFHSIVNWIAKKRTQAMVNVVCTMHTLLDIAIVARLG